MKRAFAFAVAVALAWGAPLLAQSTQTAPPPGRQNDPTTPTVTAPPPAAQQPRLFRSELRLSVITFSNFFQLPEGSDRVNAAITQYRGYVKPWGNKRPLEFFGHVDFQRYLNLQRENSYGGGVGANYNGEVHQWGAYIDRGENRAAFDVGDQTAIANVTIFGADYAYRPNKTWEFELDGSRESQRFSVQTGSENDYDILGAGVRYRGFGYKFQPRAGYFVTRRDSKDDSDSFDGDYWSLGFVSAPHRRVYLSVAWRQHTRDYSTNNPASSNFGRKDDRGQLVFAGVFRLTDRVGLSSYYSRESVDSSRPGRDFDGDYLILGVNYGF